MNTTFPEVVILAILCAAAFWLLASCVRWLVPAILVVTWLLPVAGMTWLLWIADDVLSGMDHPGVSLFLHVATSIAMGTVMILGAAAIASSRSSGGGHGYGRLWWFYHRYHHHHHSW